jgi:clan AA aspartic protease (TIGR02281 family)
MISRALEPERNILVWLVLCICLLCGSSASADAYYDQGVALYNKRNYKAAAPYFDYLVRNSSRESNVYYYSALNYQQLNDWPRAKQMYRILVERFQDSEAGRLASSVLQKYDPDFMKKMASAGRGSVSRGSSQAGGSRGGVTNARSEPMAYCCQGQPASSRGVHTYGGRAPGGYTGTADYARLPRESTVSFQRKGNSQHIEGYVNGQAIEMVFDTGASSCVFGKNHLQEMGVRLPSGPPTGQSVGVGSSTPVGTWEMPVTFRVGNMELHNFVISIQEYLSAEPLLGQTFFQNFEVSTDTVGNTITFRKREATARFEKNDRNNVPFRKYGNNLIVNVKVNGQPCAMYFDTGADGVSFTLGQLRKLGMEIPEDAEAGQSVGIGGATKSFHFTVHDMELGPIFKENVEVTVVEDAHMQFPLLGQTFFKEAEYSIDYNHNVIHFKNP